MITTVTLNAAIDKTYYVNEFTIGQVKRVDSMRAVAGGKGINVARVIQQLGEESFIIGCAGGYNGQFIRTALDQQSLKHDLVNIHGESRVNINIMDQLSGTSTEILELGPTIGELELSKFIAVLEQAAKLSKFIVLSGSLPPGSPAQLYRTLIEIVREHGAQVILDTSGEALREGIQAQPFMIKPNEEELSVLTGRKINSEDDLLDIVKMIMEQGVTCVAVSLGANGSIVGYEGNVYRVFAPKVEAVNPVGSGDSFTAGFAVAMVRGLPIEECLLVATASGTANAMNAQAGHISMEHYSRYIMESRVTLLHEMIYNSKEEK